MVSPVPPALPISGGDRDVWAPKLNAVLQWGIDSIAAINLASTVHGPTTVSGSVTVDFATGGVQFLDLTGDVTSLTFTNLPSGGSTASLWIRQAGSGGYTVTWPNTVHWPNGTPAVVTTNLGRRDLYTFAVYSGGLYLTSASTGLL